MTARLAGEIRRLGWNARRVALAGVRIRQPVHVFRTARRPDGSTNVVMYVGDYTRGSYFVQHLVGEPCDGMLAARVSLGPRPSRVAGIDIERDLELIEVNQLYVERFRRAGYVLIPGWVEFGRQVVNEENTRYAGASKPLRKELRAIARAGFDVVISKRSREFTEFYETMYLPYARARFGPMAIVKKRARARRDFRAGFLMLLRDGGMVVAGGIVRDEGSAVSLTMLGVLQGSDEILRSHVSGAIDFHLHRWAADHGKRYIKVGHTRPFPKDGVYFNKRKWQMEVYPDIDGTTSLALGIRSSSEPAAHLLNDCPFVYQARSGLGVFCVHVIDRTMDADGTKHLIKRLWTPGLASMIIVCPGGYRDEVPQSVSGSHGSRVHLCTDLATALRIYRFDL